VALGTVGSFCSRCRPDRELVAKSAAESGDNGWAEGEVLQEWRNIGQFSAVLVRISDCRGAPDENRFTMSRTGEMGVRLSPCLKSKRRSRLLTVCVLIFPPDANADLS
jgi:hypothetical protein